MKQGPSIKFNDFSKFIGTTGLISVTYVVTEEGQYYNNKEVGQWTYTYSDGKSKQIDYGHR